MSDDARWRLLFAKKLEHEVVEAFRIFRDAGIEPVLIKGWAAARHYPRDVPRFYDDVDLVVSDEDFDAAKQVMKTDAGKEIGIDLHRELRHLDTKLWHEIRADSQQIDLDGDKIRVPSDEDHLRILAVHWLNDGGIPKDRLWDIVYAVRNRRVDFNWDKCLKPVSDLRQQWIITAIALAHKYMGLEVEDLPFAARTKDLPQWLTATLEREWESGVRLISLHTCLNNPKNLFTQIKKRIPPNALQATIEMEGSIDNSSRIPYQFSSILNRIGPSIRGIRGTLKRN